MKPVHSNNQRLFQQTNRFLSQSRQTSHPPLLHEAGTNVHPASDIVPLSRTSTHKTPSGFFREISKMPRSMHSWPTEASKIISFHMKDILFEDPSVNVNLLVADLSSPRKLSFFWISAFPPKTARWRAA